MPAIQQRDPIHLDIKNIGDIDTSTVTLLPGLNVLVGNDRLWSHSVMQALTATYGNQNVSLRTGASEGYAKLTLGSESCTHHFARSDGNIVSDGDPCLDDLDLNGMFAFFLESNRVRTSLVSTGNYTDIVQRASLPEGLRSEAKELQQQLDKFERKFGDDRSDADSLELIAADADSIFSDVSGEYIVNLIVRSFEDETFIAVDRDCETEIQKFKELHNAFCRYDSVESKIDTARNTIESLREEKVSLCEEIDDLEEVSEGEIEDLERRIETLRTENQSLKSDLDIIQQMVRCNELMLGSDAGFLEDLYQRATEKDIFTHEVDDDRCWVCGCSMDMTALEQFNSLLRAERSEKMSRYDGRLNRLKELKAELQRKKSAYDQRSTLIDRQADIESELKKRRRQLAQLQKEKQKIDRETSSLQREMADIGQLISAARLEKPVDLGTATEEQFSSLQRIISRVELLLEEDESRVQKRKTIQRRYREVTEEIDATTREYIERIAQEMNALLEMMDHERIVAFEIDRASIGDEPTNAVRQFSFKILAVLYKGSDRTRIPIEQLDRADRELVAVLFSVAGYLIHEVHKEIPIFLIDMCELNLNRRIKTIVDYLSDRIPYVVVASSGSATGEFTAVSNKVSPT